MDVYRKDDTARVLQIIYEETLDIVRKCSTLVLATRANDARKID
jgi:hypothetical protein